MKIISLFSGAGGLDLGFEQEGFEPVVAYDIKPAAIDTYNKNRCKIIAKMADLSTLTADDIIGDVLTNSLNETPKGVVGGPPCQYFSNGNKTVREENDPRRYLPIKYAQILQRLNEKYQLDFFILENVDGLAKPAHHKDFEKICGLFEEAGFFISYKILNAYEFGVPQIRKRLFIIGWNKNFYPKDKYEFPEGFPSGLSIKDKIGGLPLPVYYRRNLDPTAFAAHPNHWTMRPKSAKFKNPPPPDIKRGTRSFRRLDWDQPSYTVAYGHNEIHIHPEGNRRLSIYEAMLLQGFPESKDGYVLTGALSEQVTLISDAVPPPLAAALARSIREFILKNRPDASAE